VTAEPLADQLERLLLGGPRRYTRVEVAELAGVPLEEASELWRALGFADPEDPEVVFTDADVAIVRTTQALLEAGLVDPPTRVAVARMLGQSMSRLAESQVQLLLGVLERAGGVADAPEFTAGLLPVLEEIQGYVWRRHLAAHAARALAVPAAERAVVVGFADIVGYTSLARRLGEPDLVALLDTFESTAAQIVARHGGRIVKMLGDEVLYVADSPTAGADIALDLLAGELTLRAGAALGRVLPRYGDVYGPVVNLAARLTGVARPGTLLADRELAAALGGDQRYRLRQLRPVSVRGFPRLRPWAVSREPAQAPGAESPPSA
jgi:adenylate cyclase